MRNRRESNLGKAIFYSAESLTALAFSLVSISLIARHFGPEYLARYSLAQSVSTALLVFATLGLEQLIIRTLTRDPHDTEYVTSAMLGMATGWVIYVSLMLAYYLVLQDVERDLALIACVAVSTLASRVVFIKSYLQALNRPLPIAVAAVVSRVAAILFLVIGALLDFTFNEMMLYLPLQAVLLLVVMLACEPSFLNAIDIQEFSFCRLRASLREAAPLFAATGLYLLYSQSDILIMSSLLDPASVGVYSAAIRLVPLAAFIGYALVATFNRELDSTLQASRTLFENHVKSVLTILLGAGLLMAASVFIISDMLIELLYGERYAQSGLILAISCWAWVFMLPGILYSRLLIMLGLGRYELIKMVIIAPVVVLLNYLAIASIGIVASAVVFMLSYFLVDFAVYWLFRDTRWLVILGIKTLRDIAIRPIATMVASIRILRRESM